MHIILTLNFTGILYYSLLSVSQIEGLSFSSVLSGISNLLVYQNVNIQCSLPVESSLAPGECFLFHISCAQQQTTEVFAVRRTRIAGGHPPKSRIGQSTLRITKARRMMWNDGWFTASVARSSTAGVMLLCVNCVLNWCKRSSCHKKCHNTRLFCRCSVL